ncbi:MAG TPA: RluA family pseudouridine synthase [Nitrospinaceae bacterium]|nr:RluA family pseudouridine synthase [Nitrospinaceae bacterium]MDP7108923.1 RluA family pseudouridine synthase [Nitrospinaceae bacterium]HJL72997.1 RluA family pseudouridine synthase [Nitrospinaceae bacterium]HJO00784.1 RluA family pseudouridine synthase [Nitrospinaceae bacterium]
MTQPALDILYLDNHLIAVLKPAGLLTQTDHTGDDSLVEKVRQWIRDECNKPGNIFLGLVHRLDRNVSGVVLFARTSKAASRLSRQFREGTPTKIYRAIVHGTLKEKQATLIHYLRKEKSLKATVFPRETPSAKRAELSYEVIESRENKSLIEVTLATGRFHQIRAQMAFTGHPIMGDVKYGAPDPLANHKIALHAHKLVFSHPVSNEETTLTAPDPDDWLV